MYLVVITLEDGNLGQIWTRSNYDIALEKAVDLACAYCPGTPESEIRDSLDNNTYFSNGNGWTISLAQAEPD